METTEVMVETKKRHRRTLEELYGAEGAAAIRDAKAKEAAIKAELKAANKPAKKARAQAVHLLFSDSQWANLMQRGVPRDVIMDWVKRHFGE